MGQRRLDGSRYDHRRERVVEPGIGEARYLFFLILSKNITFRGVIFTYVSSLRSESNSNNGKDIQENCYTNV
jgi:hypothetical protein